MKYYKRTAFLLIAIVFFLGKCLVWLNLQPRQGDIAKVTKGNISHIEYPVQKLPSSIKHGVNVKLTYLLENPVLCTSVVNLSVLVIVHSAPTHQERRQTIRETWTNNSYYHNVGTVRVLFLLGAVKKMSLQATIENEFDKHADILQGDFIDDYHNLTYKGVMAYKWLSEKCRNAKIILKVDDDVIVNMFYFLSKYMPSFVTKKKYMSCRRFHKNKIMRTRRSKWYVMESFFSNQTAYPDYCQGFVVIITNDLVPALYKSATETPFFWVDDVYLYGLVPRNVSGIQYKHLRYGKDVVFGVETSTNCYRVKKEKCPFLVMLFRANVTSTMKEVWGLIVENNRNISKATEKNESNHALRR
ncbi:beta-1,3-galactosyltransferase 1-like isoform X1 [Mercenaria mercenaria]|uniref:beta-1,3-galactosyltransferase 1-like isoform X1 n=1 Tax=Mercenaria mercenaria TaxID=6596 RepID=UPI00234F3A0C|nr:beta-1,3-galactosyltransferase 1-like isoform X1 [Mercenaria mercenaria]